MRVCSHVSKWSQMCICGGHGRWPGPGVLLCHSPSSHCFAAMLARQRAPTALSLCLSCRCTAWLLQRCMLGIQTQFPVPCSECSYPGSCLPSPMIEYFKASGKLEFGFALSLSPRPSTSSSMKPSTSTWPTVYTDELDFLNVKANTIFTHFWLNFQRAICLIIVDFKDIFLS